jgi:hypothetical protein
MHSSLVVSLILSLSVTLSCFTCLYGSSKNDRYPNYITYELSGGRLGDNIIAYLHAKWLSHVHGIALLYKPFQYSSDLSLSQTDLSITDIDISSCITLKYRKEMPLIGFGTLFLTQWVVCMQLIY